MAKKAKRIFEMDLAELRAEAARIGKIEAPRGADKRASILQTIKMWIKRKRKNV